MSYQKNNNRERGFTMIELLVVIAVIGFIASAIFYAINIASRKSRDGARQQAITEIRKGMDLYFQANGSYPNPGTTDPISLSAVAANLAPTHMSNLNNDPTCDDGNINCNYVYRVNNTVSPDEYSILIRFERLDICRLGSPGSSVNFPPENNYPLCIF